MSSKPQFQIECGTRLLIDLSNFDFDTLADTSRGADILTLDIEDALAFYEMVEAQLGEWAREGIRARGAVNRGVSLGAFIGKPDHDRDRDSLDPSDPKHPDYADTLASAGDHLRKGDTRIMKTTPGFPMGATATIIRPELAFIESLLDTGRNAAFALHGIADETLLAMLAEGRLDSLTKTRTSGIEGWYFVGKVTVGSLNVTLFGAHDHPDEGETS